MLAKVNKNYEFINIYNGFVENDLINIKNDYLIVFKYLSENQKVIVKRYLNYGLIDNVMLFLKNIAYKKVNQIKNYYENDIKF